MRTKIDSSNSIARLLGSLAVLALLLGSCGGDPESPGQASGDSPSPGDGATQAEPMETQSFTYGFPVPAMEPGNALMAVAQEMGYFEEEGLDITFQFAGGSSDAVAGTLSGAIEIGTGVYAPVLEAVSQGEELIYFYNYLRASDSRIAVVEDSPIQDFPDLEGATIGVSSLGTGEIPFTNSVLRKEGLDPESDVEYLAVGTGPPALQALQGGDVDALALWDSQYAAMENTGAQLRYLRHPDAESLISTNAFATPEFFQENKEALARFGRAKAKATLFTATNPEAAVRIMWKKYPATRSPDLSEEEQLEDDLNVIDWRLDLLLTGGPIENKSFGSYDAQGMEDLVEFARASGLAQGEVDSASLYTNELVPQYNDFDFEAVRQQAMDWTP